MPTPPLSDALALEAIRAIHEFGGVTAAARGLGVNRSTLLSRKTIAEVRGIKPDTDLAERILIHRKIEYPQRYFLEVSDGIVVVFSDSHFWPGRVSTANKALVHFLKLHGDRVNAVINNGDALDGASISRHPSIGWENKPTLVDELKECSERLDEIRAASPNAKWVWNLGNHDARLESRLAAVAPEFAKVHGVHLKDHLPHWEPAWSTWINDSVVVKHRLKSGIHAPHNNTMWAGKSIVTGHLHSMKAMPVSDYNGTRFGVDTGCLAEPYGPQFTDYTEDGPLNWRSGFCVLTFSDSRLLWPEFVHVIEPGLVEFRGRVYAV